MANLKLFEKRLIQLVLLFTIFTAVILGQLIRVQTVSASGYVQRAQSELTQTTTLLAPRGAITDNKGEPFARSVDSYRIVVDQKMITNPSQTSEFLAPYLKMDPEIIKSKIIGTARWFEVARYVKPAIWQKLKADITNFNNNLNLENLDQRIVGIFAERMYTREYPSGHLVASLLGFTKDDGNGAAGLESAWNSTLSGINGQAAIATGFGTRIPGSQQIKVEAKPGTSLRLTIDRDIQWVAEKSITNAVKKSSALSGTVIVMDPKTGEILAHATAPTFDPNNTKKFKLTDFFNPSVQEVYEPGSTGKVMTISAAIEEKLVNPNSVFSVPYKVKRFDREIKDHEFHKTQRLTTTGILAVSSNTGTILIGESLGASKLHDYLRKFGIGQSTNSGLPGESNGILAPVSQWSGTSLPTIAFGQGYSVTAMQATQVFATIANNGVRVSPTVIAGTSDAQGRFTPAKRNQKGVRVISPETAKTMRLMMESVVTPNGTAPSAAIKGYRVAGKTGTAMRFDKSCNCYSGYTASFIGFAPADNPKYVINVTIQRPQGMHWGGALGGPVFHDVMSFVLQSKKIAPTGGKPKPMALNEAEVKHDSAA
mgnify:FL=1